MCTSVCTGRGVWTGLTWGASRKPRAPHTTPPITKPARKLESLLRLSALRPYRSTSTRRTTQRHELLHSCKLLLGGETCHLKRAAAGACTLATCLVSIGTNAVSPITASWHVLDCLS